MDRFFRIPFREFSEASQPIAKLMDEINSKASDALRDRNIQARNNALQCASIVLVSGFVESNLKANAEAFFKRLAMRGRTFADVPSEFVDRHYVDGARVLLSKAMVDRKAKLGFSQTEDIVRRLVAPLMDASKLPIWEAFAATEGNPGPRVLKDLPEEF